MHPHHHGPYGRWRWEKVALGRGYWVLSLPDYLVALRGRYDTYFKAYDGPFQVKISPAAAPDAQVAQGPTQAKSWVMGLRKARQYALAAVRARLTWNMNKVWAGAMSDRDED